MATVLTETVESISLRPLRNTSDNPEAGKDHLDIQSTTNFEPADDTIIAASRLADSQVPDGGYGWVIVFSCAVLTFWFVGTTYSW